MSKNQSKTPRERAQDRYNVKLEYDNLHTAKDKAKERHKANKEYRKFERRDRLPRFIITLIIFIIFVGVFSGLYTLFDFELDFKFRDFSEVDISTPSALISLDISNAFYNFFSTLDDISSLSNSVVSLLHSPNLSDNAQVNIYLKNLRNTSEQYLKENSDWFARIGLKSRLKRLITTYGNPEAVEAIPANHMVIPKFHLDFAHSIDISNIANVYGWDALLLHNDFLNLEICHKYNGVLYEFCNK